MSTLGDAWWLDLEDITSPPQPDLLTPADVAHSAGQPLPDPTSAPPLPLPPGKQPQSPFRSASATVSAAATGASVPAAPAAPSAAATQQQQQQQQQPPASGAASALTSGMAYLQQNIPTISSMPANFTSALTSLRGRLGLQVPASGSVSPSVTLPGLPAGPSGSVAAATSSQQFPQPQQQQQQHQLYRLSHQTAAEQDEALLQLGRRALAAGGDSGGQGGQPEGDSPPRQLVAAARHFLATCSAEQLRLGELPALMGDYRRLCRLGWSIALRWVGMPTLGFRWKCRGTLGYQCRLLWPGAGSVASRRCPTQHWRCRGATCTWRPRTCACGRCGWCSLTTRFCLPRMHRWRKGRSRRRRQLRQHPQRRSQQRLDVCSDVNVQVLNSKEIEYTEE